MDVVQQVLIPVKFLLWLFYGSPVSEAHVGVVFQENFEH